jgi:cytochrome c biogenesis factor
MWLLSFIPDWILQWAIHGLVILGLVLTFIGSLVRFIPVIQPYALVGRHLGIVLLVIGVFFEGGYVTEMSWRAKVNELQAKLKEAEVKSAEVNEKLTKEIVKNKELIREKVNQNAKDIESQRQNINAECNLSDTAWVLYNRAVEQKVSRSSTSTDGARSSTKASSQ